MTKSLVVAIEPDRNQAARLSAIVRSRVGAELVLAESAARALATLGDRVPDLILTPALLSSRDEAALAGRLRELGAAAAHVQTLTVPRIGGASVDRSAVGGMFDRFRRSRPVPAEPDGCEPEVFAQQVSAYLQRAQAERASTIPAAAAVQSTEDEPMTAFDEAFMSILDRAPVPAQESTADAVVDEAFDETVEEAPVETTAASRPVFEAIEPELPVATLEREPSRSPAPVIQAPVAAMAGIPEMTAPLSDSASVPFTVVEAFVAPLAIFDEAVGAPLVEAFATSPELAETLLNVDELMATRPVVFDAPAAVEALIAPEPFVEEFIVPVHVVEEVIEPARVTLETIAPDALLVQPAAAAENTPSFSVADVDLEFWMAEEPEPAPVEAAPVAEAPVAAEPADDRIEIAAQQADDIDMSAILDGLDLEPAEPAPHAAPEPVERRAAVEPTPFAPRRTPRGPVAVHALPPQKPARRRANGPAQDEWGLFDPQQCGFAALVAKLEAVTEDEEAENAQGTSTRLLSYN